MFAGACARACEALRAVPVVPECAQYAFSYVSRACADGRARRAQAVEASFVSTAGARCVLISSAAADASQLIGLSVARAAASTCVAVGAAFGSLRVDYSSEFVALLAAYVARGAGAARAALQGRAPTGAPAVADGHPAAVGECVSVSAAAAGAAAVAPAPAGPSLSLRVDVRGEWIVCAHGLTVTLGGLGLAASVALSEGGYRVALEGAMGGVGVRAGERSVVVLRDSRLAVHIGRDGLAGATRVLVSSSGATLAGRASDAALLTHLLWWLQADAALLVSSLGAGALVVGPVSSASPAAASLLTVVVVLESVAARLEGGGDGRMADVDATTLVVGIASGRGALGVVALEPCACSSAGPRWCDEVGGDLLL